MSAKYEENFSVWAEEQKKLLETKQFDKLDLINLIDEVGSMGQSEKRALESYIEVLLTHLLKVKYQPEMHSGSWENSICNSQVKLRKLLQTNPGLKPSIKEVFEEAYTNAMYKACEETKLPESTFPERSPWSFEKAIAWNDFKIKLNFKLKK